MDREELFKKIDRNDLVEKLASGQPVQNPESYGHGPEADSESTEYPEASEPGVPMTIGDHLDELRKRVLYSLYALFGATMICLADQEFYMKLVLFPHTQAMRALNLPSTIQVLHYEESFFCHLTVAFIAALIWTIPYMLYQIWLFVAAGLYPHEKRYLTSSFPFAMGLFMAGVVFGYFILIPIGLRFLGSYGVEEVKIGFSLSSYLSLFFTLTVVCGLIFELPLVMLVLTRLHILSSQNYISQWRYFVLAAFVVAAVLTPPDAVTQILMAIPLIMLYGVGIVVCRISERMQNIREFLRNG
jgi:Tat protein translocase TatC